MVASVFLWLLLASGAISFPLEDIEFFPDHPEFVGRLIFDEPQRFHGPGSRGRLYEQILIRRVPLSRRVNPSGPNTRQPNSRQPNSRQPNTIRQNPAHSTTRTAAASSQPLEREALATLQLRVAPDLSSGSATEQGQAIDPVPQPSETTDVNNQVEQAQADVQSSNIEQSGTSEHSVNDQAVSTVNQESENTQEFNTQINTQLINKEARLASDVTVNDKPVSTVNQVGEDFQSTVQDQRVPTVNQVGEDFQSTVQDQRVPTLNQVGENFQSAVQDQRVPTLNQVGVISQSAVQDQRVPTLNQVGVNSHSAVQDQRVSPVNQANNQPHIPEQIQRVRETNKEQSQDLQPAITAPRVSHSPFAHELTGSGRLVPNQGRGNVNLPETNSRRYVELDRARQTREQTTTNQRRRHEPNIVGRLGRVPRPETQMPPSPKENREQRPRRLLVLDDPKPRTQSGNLLQTRLTTTAEPNAYVTKYPLTQARRLIAQDDPRHRVRDDPIASPQTQRGSEANVFRNMRVKIISQLDVIKKTTLAQNVTSNSTLKQDKNNTSTTQSSSSGTQGLQQFQSGVISLVRRMANHTAGRQILEKLDIVGPPKPGRDIMESPLAEIKLTPSKLDRLLRLLTGMKTSNSGRSVLNGLDLTGFMGIPKHQLGSASGPGVLNSDVPETLDFTAYNSNGGKRTMDELIVDTMKRYRGRRPALGTYDRAPGFIATEMDTILTLDQWRYFFGDLPLPPPRRGPRPTVEPPRLHERHKRKAIKHWRYYWPDRIIPYELNENEFSWSDVMLFERAMHDWEQSTCIRFRMATPKDKNRIRFRDGPGCSSHVGMIGGAQNITLQGPCRIRRIVLHEIGHALGLVHEHQRPDRDNFILIKYDNARPGTEWDFKKRTWASVVNHTVAYDYKSVMHYGPFAFSMNRSRPTILARDTTFQGVIGKVTELSFDDKKLVNMMYQCNSHCPDEGITCQYGGYVDKDCNCVCPPNHRNCRVSRAQRPPPIQQNYMPGINWYALFQKFTWNALQGRNNFNQPRPRSTNQPVRHQQFLPPQLTNQRPPRMRETEGQRQQRMREQERQRERERQREQERQREHERIREQERQREQERLRDQLENQRQQFKEKQRQQQQRLMESKKQRQNRLQEQERQTQFQEQMRLLEQEPLDMQSRSRPAQGSRSRATQGQWTGANQRFPTLRFRIKRDADVEGHSKIGHRSRRSIFGFRRVRPMRVRTNRLSSRRDPRFRRRKTDRNRRNRLPRLSRSYFRSISDSDHEARIKEIRYNRRRKRPRSRSSMFFK